MRSTRSVGSSPEIVYRYYTDPSTWGDWAHNTRGATGGLVVSDGARVHVTDGFRHTWTVRATDVVPGRHVTFVNQLPGVTITSSYDVQPGPGGCRIDHVIEMRGRWEIAYRPLQPLYGHLLKLETERLKGLAEHGAPAAPPQTE
jgi:uncharacterized protein YndB with AHSA1/START domain